MKKKIALIVEQIEAAENTSAFKPAQQIQHVKFALNGAVNLLSEIVGRIEDLEAKHE